MSDFTPRANLRLPGGGSTGTILPDEQVDIDVLNDNFRKIDALLGARNIPSASSYAGSMDGDLVYAQDTEFLHMFSANAGGLITPRLPGSKMFSGTRAQRMAFTGARDGDMWRDTDNIGIIWAFKAGSPGTWGYSGNKCRGTKADILQTDTDGIAVPGMTAFCTDDNSDYARGATAWRRSGLIASGTITAQSQFYIGGLQDADRYEVTLILPTASTANDINMRVTSGGVQDSSGNYDKQLLQGSSTTPAAVKQIGQTVWGEMVGAKRTVKTVRATLLNLNRAERTFAEVRASGWDAAGNLAVAETALWHNVASAFNGVWFNVEGSGTVTGRYEVRAS